jgi:hypothetical protein
MLISLPVRKANKVRINLDILMVQLKIKNYKINLFSFFLKVLFESFHNQSETFIFSRNL